MHSKVRPWPRRHEYETDHQVGDGSMSRRIRIILVSLFLGMQLVPSSWVVKPSARGDDDGTISIWQDPTVAHAVGRIMEHSCADCHSNLTHWPWYSRVAPASWLLARHVGHGREKLDLSEWAVRGKNGAIVRSTNEAEEICD